MRYAGIRPLWVDTSRKCLVCRCKLGLDVSQKPNYFWACAEAELEASRNVNVQNISAHNLQVLRPSGRDCDLGVHIWPKSHFRDQSPLVDLVLLGLGSHP